MRPERVGSNLQTADRSGYGNSIKTIEDVDSGTDSMDFPQEWTLPLIYGLATELCVAFGKFEELKTIKPLADQYKQIVREFDNDEEPFYLLPDMSAYGQP